MQKMAQKNMNLLTDAWIPTNTGLRSLGCWHGINTIATPPMTRLAIVRLMASIDAWEARDEGNNLEDYAGWFDLNTAFQVEGLPAESARTPREIINMIDGNNPALSPEPIKRWNDAELAQALVTAYFCDRGGLKARLPGLPISAQTPLHIGKRVKLNRGNSIRDVLDKNKITYNSDYEPPWVTGMVYPEHDTPRDDLELFLWPWRRLQIHDQGITIAAGSGINKDAVDPWVIDKASLKHLDESPNEEYEVIALALHQAKPLACWAR